MSDTKRFKSSFNGYDKNEVNKFVKEVASEYENMLNKLKKQDQDIENLQQRLLQYQGMEKSLNRALLVAEDTSNQIKRMARDESKTILEDARRNASRIVNDSLLRSEKIANEGEMLKRRIILYKRKFRQAIENQLEEIDSIDDNF